jgi:hypothetical protein
MTPAMEAHMTHDTGGCSCGKVRYEIAAAPIRGFQRQCRDCQRDTGSGHASVMVFPLAALGVTGAVTETLRTADSGEQKLKGFCGSCGSPHPFQTRMPAFADDDVVVHGDAERGRDIDDRLGHLDVGLRGRRIAAGVVVHQQTARAIRLM